IITQEPAPGTIISGHNTTETITLRAEDASGNFVTCSFEVTLLDQTAPEIIFFPTDTTGGLTADCTFLVPDYWAGTAATATDNCRPTGTASTEATGNQIQYRQSPLPGTVLSGDFTEQVVVLTADDGNGNSVSCDFILSLIDTIAPSILCPIDTVANPDEGCDFVLEDYTDRAIIDDNCTEMGDLVVTQSPPEGTLLSGQGASQEITLRVTDASGNSTSCTFTLSLQDTISPSIVCPNDRTEELSADCTFLIPDYTGGTVTTDNCTERGTTAVRQDPTPGTLVTGQNEGDSFVVTLTADDGNGNTANCRFTITLDDVIDPVLVCPADSVIYVDATCTAALPDLVAVTSATDNCGTPTISQQPASGVEFTRAGTQVPVTLLADDGNGNTSQCLVTVTLRDTISPMIVCPDDEVLFVNADCMVSLPDYRPQPIVTDNCTSSGEIRVSQDPAPGTILYGHESIQEVTLTASDGNGNTRSCTFEVSLEDNTSPTIECPLTQTQFADATCNVVVDDYTGLAAVMDNCALTEVITITQMPAPGTVFAGVQSQLVTLTADDGNGNTANCEFLLQLTDNSDPTVTCPPSQVIDFGEDCTFSIPDYRALAQPDDNCSPGALTLIQSPVEGTVIDGLNSAVEVTITVRDESGNENNCRFTVTTTSPTPPPTTATVTLAVIEPPTGSGEVNLLDAFSPQAESNLSGIDLDLAQNVGIAPYNVGFFITEAAALSETGGIPANYDPESEDDIVFVRIEDPTSGCFTLSRILFDLRSPGTSNAPDLVHCNRRPFLLEIDGQPLPGGTGTTIARHEWRLIDAGTTLIQPNNLENADQQVVTVATEPLRSGIVVLEYQFFEDYGNGALVPSVPVRIAVEVQNVGAGDLFWDGN
ncbi:MAG: HYR domain-containing protein, partial [Bacteroidota bacterium]